MKRTVRCTETLDNGVETEFMFDPVDGAVRRAQVGDIYVVGYLTPDDDYGGVEDLMGDCMGVLRRYSDGNPWLDNPDAVALGCYGLGEQHWYIHDPLASLGVDGVWVPDACLLEDMNGLEGEGRRRAAVKYCRHFLATYNAVLAGEVYGVVTEWFDAHGKQEGQDHYWGVVGRESAEGELACQFTYQCEQLMEV